MRKIDPWVVTEPGSAGIAHDPERILSQVLLYKKNVAKKKNWNGLFKELASIQEKKLNLIPEERKTYFMCNGSAHTLSDGM